jgi:hypothetical protein
MGLVGGIFEFLIVAIEAALFVKFRERHGVWVSMLFATLVVFVPLLLIAAALVAIILMAPEA